MPTLLLTDEHITHRVGAAIGRLAPPGTVIALHGELGAGKTTLAKGVGVGLEVPGVVSSPSFIIVAEHGGGRLPLVHADLYRIGDASELEELGLDERMEDGESLVLLEWATRCPGALPADHLSLRFAFEPGEQRSVQLCPSGPRAAALTQALMAELSALQVPER